MSVDAEISVVFSSQMPSRDGLKCNLPSCYVSIVSLKV